MKQVWLPLVLFGCACVGAWVWLTGDADPHADRRAGLRSADPAHRRAALQAIAADRTLALLPEVTRLWEQTYAAEGFQRHRFRPGSLQGEIHAVFAALGPPAAEQLIGWAEQAPGRFVPCLVAAGVALGGNPSTELGPGAESGGVQIRAYHFAVGGTTLDVPTYLDADWYGRLEILRAWKTCLATVPR